MRFPFLPSDRSSGAAGGVGSSFKQILSASGRYASARARMMLLEGRLAAHDLKSPGVMFICAAAGLLVAISLLIAGLVLWVAQQLMNGNTAAACGVIGGALLLDRKSVV